MIVCEYHMVLVQLMALFGEMEHLCVLFLKKFIHWKAIDSMDDRIIPSVLPSFGHSFVVVH